MKQLVILFLTIGMVISCGTPQAVKESEKSIKGEWVMRSITHNESGDFDITIFRDESGDCFEGSTWSFVPNNNRGTYSIGSGGCTVGERNFIFTIQEVDASTGYYDFLLKPTDEKWKSETNQGFRMNLAYLSDTEMTWKQNLNVDGNPFTLIMNFDKIN